MSHKSVCWYVATFKAGQQNLTDAAHSGRRPTTTTRFNIKKITDLLNTDARYIVGDRARMANFSSARVHGILRKHLKVRNINARRIPHLLTDEQKRSHIINAENLLKLFPKYRKKSLKN